MLVNCPVAHRSPRCPMLAALLLTTACGTRTSPGEADAPKPNTNSVASPGNSGPSNSGRSGTPSGPGNELPAMRAWRHPLSLQDNVSMDGNDADSGSVAVARDGDAIFTIEYGSRAYCSERRGGTWYHPIRNVSVPHNPRGGSMFDPRMAMTKSGNTLLVWIQRDSGIDRVYAATYVNGTWTDPTGHDDHLSPVGNGAENPWPVLDSFGNGVVVWVQATSSFNGRIFKAEWHNGTWTVPLDENDGISPGASNCQDVHMAIGPNNHIVVVWAQGNGPHYSIYKSERRAGVWSHPSSLADSISPAGSSAVLPKVAFDGAGNAVIAWIQGDGTHDQVFKSELRGGAWTHPSGLSDNISPDGSNAQRVQVAAGRNGEAVIVWRQALNATDTGLLKSEYRGGVWTHPGSLAAEFSVGTTVHEFVVAVDPVGETVVAYCATDGVANVATYLSEYRLGLWQHATALSQHISPVGPDTAQPTIGVDGFGAFVLFWQQSDGTHRKSFLSEYR